MELIQILGIAVMALIAVITLKSIRPDMALMVSIAAGILIFTLTAFKLSGLVSFLSELSENASLNSTYFGILIKLVGIAYLTEFASEICKDAGEASIASKVELAGKIFIIAVSAPVFVSLINLILELV